MKILNVEGEVLDSVNWIIVNWRLSTERGERLQGLCDLLCLFGHLMQQDCLQKSVHSVTVRALKARCLCNTKKSLPFAENEKVQHLNSIHAEGSQNRGFGR